MFSLPNTSGQLFQDVQKLRRKYENARLEQLKKVRDVVQKVASDEKEYMSAVFSAPKKTDDTTYSDEP